MKSGFCRDTISRQIGLEKVFSERDRLQSVIKKVVTAMAEVKDGFLKKPLFCASAERTGTYRDVSPKEIIDILAAAESILNFAILSWLSLVFGISVI